MPGIPLPRPRRVLCVAEKPSIAKEIARILGEGQAQMRPVNGNVYVKNYTFPYKLPPDTRPVHFTVTSVLGHVNEQDFPDETRKWYSCDPISLFDERVVSSVGKKMQGVVNNLSSLARDHDLLLIWTDCDREGEHIGWEVLVQCQRGNRDIRVLRSKFSAIIPAQIHNAARNPVELDMNSVAAVQVRTELDLRTGAALTRMQTLALQAAFPELDGKVISYGSCQFPTLGFVVARYLLKQSFVSEPFWSINVSHERGDDEGGESSVINFNWRRNHLFDFEAVVVLYEQCVENPTARVTKVETKPTKKFKPYPLTTVDLQKSGSRLLHMSPKKILEHAEKLYQKGFLSYPRTETDQFDPAFDFLTLIDKQTQDPNWGDFARGLQNGGFSRPRNGRKNDKAHPPIHPTAWTNDTNGDEKRVYEFVVRRFLASCSSDAEGKTTTVEIDISEEEFSASGLVIIARNYLDVFRYDRWNGSYIPDFQVGETFVPTSCEMKEGATTGPNLLTEADLVGLMDQNGIGTDATIAEHIAKIVDREYVMEQQHGQTKYLVPSNLGIALVEGWDQIGFDKSLCKPHLRREMEHRMQLVCDGLATKNDVLVETIDQYKEVFTKARREINTLKDAVRRYIDVGQEAPAAQGRGGGPAGRGRGRARGGRASAGRNNDDDDDLSDGNDDEPPASAVRGRGRGRGRGATAARGRGAARGGRGAAAAADDEGIGLRPRGGGTVRGRGASSEEDEGDDAPAPPPARRRRIARQEEDEDEFENGGGAGEAAPQCGCRQPAVQRTVMRETENKGRKFWCCAKPKDDGDCGFFEFCGPAAGGSRGGRGAAAGTRSGPSARHPAAGARNERDGALKCECNLTAVNRTVQKEGGNKGRIFWTCPNSEAARCKFFEWDDERQDGGGGGGGGSSSRGGRNRGARGGARGSSTRGARGGGNSGGGGGGGNASDVCYKCQETGHWASNCPNADGGSRPSRGRGSRGSTRARGGRGSRGGR